MKQLNDTITFRNGASVNNRIIQTPMLTNSGIHEEACLLDGNYQKEL